MFASAYPLSDKLLQILAAAGCLPVFRAHLPGIQTPPDIRPSREATTWILNRGQEVGNSTRQMNGKNAGGETALERLCDRESLRTLSIALRMMLENMRWSETRQLKILEDNARRKLIYFFDQLLTIADDITKRAEQKRSLADVCPGGSGDSDDA